MTRALIGLQVLFIVLFALSFSMARFSRRGAWLWLMGLSAIGIVICAVLAYWAPLLGLAGIE
jgi:hypothetical protein